MPQDSNRHSSPSIAITLALVAGLLVIVAATLCFAQSGGRYDNVITEQGSGSASRQLEKQPPAGGAPQGSGRRQIKEKPFEQRFREYLKAAEYRNWAPLPGQTAALFPGQSPHGAFLKVYVNRTAAGDPKNVPLGSILIKENYAADQETLGAITVMYRSKGFDPQNGDWYWVKYEPSGQVSQMEGTPLAGRASVCIDCHRSADGDDLVFLND